METLARSPERQQAAAIVARILLEIGAVNFRPRDPYILTSGWASPVYIDCRKVIAFPRARQKIISLAVDLVEREIGFDALDSIAGGETAGIPYAAWLADRMALPMHYVRKKPKGFGRMAQIEGDLKEGQRTLLVEDLATDGGSKVHFVKALRDAGACCQHALVVFFYGIFPDALDRLHQDSLNLHYLCTWHDVLRAASQSGVIDPATVTEVQSFLEDPEGWSAANKGRAA